MSERNVQSVTSERNGQPAMGERNGQSAMGKRNVQAGRRFSPTAYANQVIGKQCVAPNASVRLKEPEGALQSFKALAEEIRSFLAAPRGRGESEQRRHNERLNRAVLGFRQEREEVLALVTDQLIRRRVHEVSGYQHPFPTLAEALFAEVVGLNVLELVMQEGSALEEIQVVGTQIYEVRKGRTRKSVYAFNSPAEVVRIQQNLVLYNNDRINPRKRWAEVMLTDGARVTMTGFGFTLEPTLTIRLYAASLYTLEELCAPAWDTIDRRIMKLLQHVLEQRSNLVVIGATNSGKTHLIKALIAQLPEEERIITIEHRLEMMLRRDFPGRNIIEYEADEEDGMHRAAQAFKLALRQSPQRIVHAEIRDEDANIYVRACTRGHAGSMTTVHASTLEDVPEAIADMCMLDGRGMNPERLTKRIAQYVTQVGIEMRQYGSKRKVARIGRFNWIDGQVRIEDWVRYDEARQDWIWLQGANADADDAAFSR